MNFKSVLLFFCLLTSTLTFGQIKIGTNPQNIDASSVLELESTSKALILTRVNTTQMNAIIPLQGALVYNTESKCVHYYDGSRWLNICETLTNSVNISLTDNGDGTYTFSDATNKQTQINNLNESLLVEDGNLILRDSAGNIVSVALQDLNEFTFTTDAIINTFPTIFITQDANGSSFNFEVGIINGENIQDGSIKQADLAGSSVGSAQLRDNSVRNVAMADNAVGSPEIINGSVQPIDIAPGTNNQLLTTNGAGAVQWTDLSGLVAADDVSYDPADSGLTANSVKLALDELAFQSSDDQLLSLETGNILTLEGGGTVNLNPFLDNTDNQAITAFSLDNASNILTLTLEDGGSQNVNFTTVLAAAGTDDQALTLETGNILTLEGGGTVNLNPFLDNTDNQAITAFSLDNASNILTLTLEDGGSQNVNFTTVLAAAGTDDQALTLETGNILTLEGGGTVNLNPFLDNTDNQAITAFSLDNASNILTLTLEDGGSQNVNFTTVLAAAGTDDQALTLETGNILTLEGGGTVNLNPFLDNTDNQAITAFSLDNASNILTLTLEDGGSQNVNFTTVLAAAGTDDQALTLETGNILTLEGGGTVNLNPFLDNTDNQAITAFSLDNASNILTLTLEDGGSQNVNFTTVLAAAGTDDQALTLETGNILTLEGGGTVNLNPFLDNTDNQAITAFGLDNASNILTLTLEDGGSQNVNFTTVLAAAGTDNQTLSLAANSLSIEDANNVDLAIKPITNINTDIALDPSNYSVILGTGGLYTTGVTLPDTVSNEGRIYIIKNLSGSPVPISSYLNGLGTSTSTVPNGVIQIQSDGTNWQQIN